MRVATLCSSAIGHRQRLGETLGLVVTAARADGVDVAPVFLRLRMHQRVAVNFGSRGQQEARVFFLGQAERLVRAERADLEGLNRQFQIINRAGRRREMPDVIHRAFQEQEFGDILLNELELRIAAEVRDVVHAAGDEIVYADDFVAARDQQVGEMRAEKAGGPGDDGRGLCVSHCQCEERSETPGRFNDELSRRCARGRISLSCNLINTGLQPGGE